MRSRSRNSSRRVRNVHVSANTVKKSIDPFCDCRLAHLCDSRASGAGTAVEKLISGEVSNVISSRVRLRTCRNQVSFRSYFFRYKLRSRRSNSIATWLHASRAFATSRRRSSAFGKQWEIGRSAPLSMPIRISRSFRDIAYIYKYR